MWWLTHTFDHQCCEQVSIFAILIRLYWKSWHSFKSKNRLWNLVHWLSFIFTLKLWSMEKIELWHRMRTRCKCKSRLLTGKWHVAVIDSSARLSTHTKFSEWRKTVSKLGDRLSQNTTCFCQPTRQTEGRNWQGKQIGGDSQGVFDAWQSQSILLALLA